MGAPARLALCLALAVLFAGCGSTGTNGRADTRASLETVTPVPVPTDERPRVREGVDHRLLVDLAERHEAALAGRSFTTLGRRVVTGPVGVLLDLRWERRVSADRGTYHAVRSGTATWGWDGRDPIDRRHRYHAGNRTLTRYESGGEVRHEIDPDPPPGGTVTDLDGADHLRELFGAFAAWRVVRYPNGSLALSGRDLERPGVVGVEAPLSDPRNATVEVEVERGGRIARAAVRFEATVDGMPASVVEVRRYVGVGETATERPPWYGTALEARTATPTVANATATDPTSWNGTTASETPER